MMNNPERYKLHQYLKYAHNGRIQSAINAGYI